ncbi:MAG: dihydrofolate reductase family protein [Chloroflexota bacterium]
MVFSRTLERVDAGSRLVNGDAVEEAARLKSEPGGNMDVGGAALAGSLIAAGLVDEYRLLIHPVILGAGHPLFPPLEERVSLRFIESRTFRSGVVYLRYEAVNRQD